MIKVNGGEVVLSGKLNDIQTELTLAAKSFAKAVRKQNAPETAEYIINDLLDILRIVTKEPEEEQEKLLLEKMKKVFNELFESWDHDLFEGETVESEILDTVTEK